MKKIILFLLCTFVCFFSFGQSNEPEIFDIEGKCCRLPRIMPKTAHIDNSGYDITKYRLEIDANPDVSTFSGTTIIYFTTSENITQLSLNAEDNLIITDILFKGNSISGYTRDGRNLIIDLPNALNSNSQEEISISFAGNAEASVGYIKNNHNGTPMVYTKSEAYSGPTWWVCKDDLEDKADELELVITHPNKYKAAGNGLLISETDNSDGTITTYWKHQYPIPVYLVGIAVTNYQEYNNSVTVGETQMPIINYLYPESLTDETKAALDKVPSFIEFLNERFGEYPYKNEKYGHAEWKWGGGMEHSTMSFVINFRNELVIHELMHQWFGDKITCATWSDIWLNEGFATHAEALLIEHLQGEEAYRTWKSKSIETIIQDPSGSVYNPDPLDESRIFLYRLTYVKAGMVVNMLRFMLGDDLYFSAMRDYLNRPELAYGFATTDDLQKSLEQSTGLDFTEFFNDWVYGEGYPIFDVYVDQTSTNEISVTIDQTSAHNSVSFFETPFQIEFYSHDGQKYKTRLDLTQNNQTFKITDIPFKVTKAIFNPDYDIIASVNKLSLNKEVISGVKPLNISPNPVKDYLKISTLKTLNNVQVCDLSGKVVIQNMNINDITYDIDFTSLPSGNYIIRFTMNDGETMTEKVMKE